MPASLDQNANGVEGRMRLAREQPKPLERQFDTFDSNTESDAMRAPTLALTSALLLAAGLSPASAQLSGGAIGSANATNQSFQQQNQMRSNQQQNNFNANQNRLQNSTNSMNTSVRSSGGVPRLGTGGTAMPRAGRVARPERER